MKELLAISLLGTLALPAAAQDTTVVRSSGPGLWRNPRLVEELRIGVVEGDDRYIFGQVIALAVTSDGSIWVADGQGPRVRIYDRNRRYVRDVYRTGAGPGEIKGVMGIDITPNREVAIWDLPNHRESLYRENGEYLRTFAALSNWWGGDAFQVDTAGRFWVYTSVRNPACIRRYTSPDGTVREVGSEGPGCGRSAYLRYSAAGVLMDTVFIPVPQAAERTPSFVIMLPEGPAEPFVAEWDFGLSPHGYLVTAHSSRYAINVVREVRAGARQQVTPSRGSQPDCTSAKVRVGMVTRLEACNRSCIAGPLALKAESQIDRAARASGVHAHSKNQLRYEINQSSLQPIA